MKLRAKVAYGIALTAWITVFGLYTVCAGSLRGSEFMASSSQGETDAPLTQPGTRYGLFGLLDHRSNYGQGLFAEPFLVDETDLENEVRLDWLRTEDPDLRSDFAKVEIEKSFGLLTLELELPYEREVSGGITSEGIGNISLGARHPVYQFVSRDESIDSTLGVAIETGIPVNSSVSKNAELVPKIFNDLALGKHFTLQTIVGYSTLFGGGPDGGLQSFEYGLVLGYAIQHAELPIPGLLQLVPVFELKGETRLNHEERGQNELFGNIALRADLKSIAGIQPRPGIGLVFPIDKGARAQEHWGIYTSLVFEY